MRWRLNNMTYGNLFTVGRNGQQVFVHHIPQKRPEELNRIGRFNKIDIDWLTKRSNSNTQSYSQSVISRNPSINDTVPQTRNMNNNNQSAFRFSSSTGTGYFCDNETNLQLQAVPTPPVKRVLVLDDTCHRNSKRTLNAPSPRNTNDSSRDFGGASSSKLSSFLATLEGSRTVNMPPPAFRQLVPPAPNFNIRPPVPPTSNSYIPPSQRPLGWSQRPLGWQPSDSYMSADQNITLGDDDDSMVSACSMPGSTEIQPLPPGTDLPFSTAAQKKTNCPESEDIMFTMTREMAELNSIIAKVPERTFDGRRRNYNDMFSRFKVKMYVLEVVPSDFMGSPPGELKDLDMLSSPVDGLFDRVRKQLLVTETHIISTAPNSKTKVPTNMVDAFIRYWKKRKYSNPGIVNFPWYRPGPNNTSFIEYSMNNKTFERKTLEYVPSVIGHGILNVHNDYETNYQNTPMRALRDENAMSGKPGQNWYDPWLTSINFAIFVFREFYKQYSKISDPLTFDIDGFLKGLESNENQPEDRGIFKIAKSLQIFRHVLQMLRYDVHRQLGFGLMKASLMVTNFSDLLVQNADPSLFGIKSKSLSATSELIKAYQQVNKVYLFALQKLVAGQFSPIYYANELALFGLSPSGFDLESYQDFYTYLPTADFVDVGGLFGTNLLKIDDDNCYIWMFHNSYVYVANTCLDDSLPTYGYDFFDFYQPGKESNRYIIRPFPLNYICKRPVINVYLHGIRGAQNVSSALVMFINRNSNKPLIDQIAIGEHWSGSQCTAYNEKKCNLQVIADTSDTFQPVAILQ